MSNQKSERLTALPFGRMFAEGMLIVLSILLAFGIDAWWAMRKDSIEEQETLHGLKKEFVQNRALLEKSISNHEKNILILDKLLNAMEKGSREEVALLIDDVVVVLLSPTTTDLGNGALNALLSSGRIDLLANKDLRTLLAAWNGVLGEVQDDQANYSKIVFEQNIPYVMRNGIPASAPMSHWYQEWPVAKRSISQDPAALTRLMEDPEFRVLVEIVYGYKRHLSGEFAGTLTMSASVLAEIESSLD